MFEKITPKHINTWADFTMPIWFLGLCITLPLGLYYALFNSPADYQQGESVRIMYIHVPSAYIATSAYAGLALSSVFILIWKSPASEIIARSIAPLGMVASTLCLFTGAIWGQPTWGTWWVWDARLTSVLILFFIYVTYIATAYAFDDKGGGSKPAAILAVAGAINLPIIKYSVDWWNTLHQPASLIRDGGASIHPDMLLPLLLMMGAFTCGFAILFIWRIRTITAQRKIKTLLKQKAQKV